LRTSFHQSHFSIVLCVCEQYNFVSLSLVLKLAGKNNPNKLDLNVV